MRCSMRVSLLVLLAVITLALACQKPFNLRLYGYTFQTDVHDWFDQAGTLAPMFQVVLAMYGLLPPQYLPAGLSATNAQLLSIYTKGQPASVGPPGPFGSYQKLIKSNGREGDPMYNILFSGNPWTKPNDIDLAFRNLISLLQVGGSPSSNDPVGFFQFLQHTVVIKIAFDYWDRAIHLVQRKGPIEGTQGSVHMIDMAWAVFAGKNLTGPFASYQLGLQQFMDNTATEAGLGYGYFGGDMAPGAGFMTMALAGAHADAVVAARNSDLAGITTAAKKAAALYAEFGLQLLQFTSYSNDYALSCNNTNITNTVQPTAHAYQITCLNTTLSLITGLGGNKTDLDMLYAINGPNQSLTTPIFPMTNAIVQRIVVALHNQTAELYMDDSVLGTMIPSRVAASWVAFGEQHGIPSFYDLNSCTAPAV